jgi:hypothetical protein
MTAVRYVNASARLKNAGPRLGPEGVDECSCRGYTSDSAPTLKHILNTPASDNRGEPVCELLTECDEIKSLVDGLSLGIDTQSAARHVELPLIYNDILTNPARSPTAKTSGRLSSGTSGATCDGFSHVISRLYDPQHHEGFPTIIAAFGRQPQPGVSFLVPHRTRR